MNEVEAVGFAMWKAEADRAAPNVGKNRAIENYRYDLDPTSRAKWDQIAQAAIAALDAARGDSEPVAWLYEHPEGYYNTTTRRDDPSLPTYRGWIETPLYAHPPRGDQVARFVAHMKTLQPDEDVAECPATWGDFLQILEAEAEAWEPFNG